MRHVKDEDDPKRCRATSADGGQCRNESGENSQFCRVHGGHRPPHEEMNAYLTEQFERRLKIGTDAGEEIKLLRENLMKLNMVIAARTNLMKDEASMLAHSGPIADLVMKAEKVTASLHRLAIASGLLLAQPALITWGLKITQAVHEMVKDKYDGWEDDLMDFSHQVESIIIRVENTEEDKR